MKHKNGFHYLDWHLNCLGEYGNSRIVHSILMDKANKRDSRLGEYKQTAPMVFGKLYPELYQSVWNANEVRARRVSPRLARFKAYVEEQNRKYLATLSPEQAQAAFFMKADENGGSCIKWFEQLPCGIDYQAASKATGLTFWLEWWEGNVRRSWEYSPNADKPRKFRQVAKAI